MELKTDSEARLEVLTQLLRQGEANTQDDLCRALKQKKFHVTQSTISRDLRRIGAIKTNNSEGETVYKLPEENRTLPLTVSDSLGRLLINIQANDNLIVLHTSPGSASLVARHIDNMRNDLGILGTIAGDDTIFIAPLVSKNILSLMRKIKEEF